MDTFRQGSPLATWPWRLGLGDLALATWLIISGNTKAPDKGGF